LGLLGIFSGFGVSSEGKSLVGEVRSAWPASSLKAGFIRAVGAGVRLAVRAGVGGGGGGLLPLDWGLGFQNSVLVDGVVGLALSVNGLFHGLVEVARLLFVADTVGLRSVEVSNDDGILAGGVEGED
jgi:hypothetical protein